MSLDDIVEFVTKYGDAQGGVEQIDAILDVFDQVSLSEFLTLVHAAVENPDELYQSTGLKALKIMIGALTKNNERVSSEKGSKVNFTDRDKSDIWNILSKSIASSSATIRESGVVTGLSMPDEIRTTFLSAGITSENEDVRKRLLSEIKNSGKASDNLAICQALDDSNEGIKQSAVEILKDKTGVTFSNTKEAMEWWGENSTESVATSELIVPDVIPDDTANGATDAGDAGLGTFNTADDDMINQEAHEGQVDSGVVNASKDGGAE